MRVLFAMLFAFSCDNPSAMDRAQETTRAPVAPVPAPPIDAPTSVVELPPDASSDIEAVETTEATKATTRKTSKTQKLAPASPRKFVSTPDPPARPRNCRKGCPCGNSCISCKKVCRK